MLCRNSGSRPRRRGVDPTIGNNWHYAHAVRSRIIPDRTSNMEKELIKRIVRTPIMHRVVEHQGVAYFGGVIADNLVQSVGAQTREVLSKLDVLLREAGSGKDRLLSAQIFLADMNGKSAMNEAWQEWLDPQQLPARATIGVSDLGPGVLVEIVITAAVN